MIKRVWNCNNVIKVKFLDNPKSQQATGNHLKLNFGIERVLLSREVDKQGRLGDSFTTLGERITFKNTRKYSILFRLIRTKFVQHWFTSRKPLCKIGNWPANQRLSSYQLLIHWFDGLLERVLKIFISSEIFEKFRGSKTKEMSILKFFIWWQLASHGRSWNFGRSTVLKCVVKYRFWIVRNHQRRARD